MPVPAIHHEAAEPQTLNEIRNWHRDIVDALVDQRAATRRAIHLGSPIAPRFVGMTEAEIDFHYDKQRRELDRLTVLNLVASAEAAITMDYFRRVKEKSKDALARKYRKWYSELSARKQLRPDFDERGILDLLKKSHLLDNHILGRYRECRKVRHWLGHGRYWAKPVEVDQLDPIAVYNRSQALLRAMPA